MADVVAVADVDQGLAGFPSRNGLLALVVRQFWLAAHHHALGFGAFPAFAGATTDQFPLKLGEAPRTVRINLPCTQALTRPWWIRSRRPRIAMPTAVLIQASKYCTRRGRKWAPHRVCEFNNLASVGFFLPAPGSGLIPEM
jgi:hypothetical protein